MLRNLALVLKSKLALAILGAVLVAGAGTTVALASTGKPLSLPLVGQGQSSRSSGHDGSRDGADDGDHGQSGDQNDIAHQAEGTVSSISGNSSFVLKSEHSGDVTVVVNAQTVFDNGISSFADLKAGMFVEVRGTVQANNSLTATRIERGNDASGDDHSGSDDGASAGSSGDSSNFGSGGHDDSAPHG